MACRTNGLWIDGQPVDGADFGGEVRAADECLQLGCRRFHCPRAARQSRDNSIQTDTADGSQRWIRIADRCTDPDNLLLSFAPFGQRGFTVSAEYSECVDNDLRGDASLDPNYFRETYLLTGHLVTDRPLSVRKPPGSLNVLIQADPEKVMTISCISIKTL